VTSPLPPAPCILTTGQLARAWNLDRHLVTRWCDQQILKAYRLPNRQRDRRIKLTDALDFAHRHGLPLSELEKLAEQYSIIPLRCPSLLLISPTVEYMLPFVSHIFEPTMAPSSLRSGLILARRTYAAVLIDGAIGTIEAREILTLLHERCPETYCAYLACEDDALVLPWHQAGAHATWQKPCDLGQVAHEIWTALADHRPPLPPAPPAPRLHTAA